MMNEHIRRFFISPKDMIEVETKRIVRLLEFRQSHVRCLISLRQKQVLLSRILL